MNPVTAKLVASLFCGAMLASPPSAFAEPRKLVVDESVEVAAAPNEVWQRIQHFGDIHSWVPGIPNTEIVRGQDHVPGAIRIVTVGENLGVTEDLVAWNAQQRTMTYRIIQAGPLPLAQYESTLSVTPSGGGSKVRWLGTFTRRIKSDTPPTGETDADATRIIKGAYRAGLDNLKLLAEKR
jgi:carbon monoxide dehydrogenase subunit G